MVRKCMVCGVHFKKGENRSFHRFPKKLDKRDLWKQALGMSSENIVGFNTFICSDHFTDTDFSLKPSGVRYLREHATPTVAATTLHSEGSVSFTRSCNTDKENIPSNDNVELPVAVLHPTIVYGTSTDLQKFNNGSSSSLSSTLTAEGASSCTITASEENVLMTSPSKHSSTTLTASEVGEEVAIEVDSPNANKSIDVRIRKRRYPRYFGECHTSDMDSPKRARKSWDICKKKIRMQTKKIRSLQKSRSRLRARISNLNSLLKFLKDKYNLTENAESLIQASAPGTLGEILLRTRKGRSSEKYSPELRSFALTLSFYSTEAYNYVRKTFNMALPHTKTISKWYKSVDGTPGFTNEALGALKMKIEQSGHDILCNLVIDEMSIMRRIEWNGKRFTGYVDLGTEVYGDTVPEAKEVLVFMVVAVNGHWKLPVGYFLIDGLNGSEKANLVKKCLEFLHETGVKIISLTFDGAPSNINMCQILGATFDNPNDLKTYFSHPVTNEKIFIIFDAAHMLKLLRNCLATHRLLNNAEGKSIGWEYFQKLVDVQNIEGLQAATKLKRRHLNWYREKMKVCLAAQTFSNSVADALLYLSEDMRHPDFKDATATAEFVKIVNNLFDIFNSQNKYSKKVYKRAISKQNANEIFTYMEHCKNYIANLSLGGQPVLNSKRKTGFLGILVLIASIKGIFEKYIVELGLIDFLSTYKLSQDHLEIFFSAVRRKGGSNNNPTARQFEYIYKRLLVHAEIKGSDNANAIALDNTAILNVSSITKTMSGEDLEESEDYKKFSEIILQMDFLNANAWHLTPYVSDIVAYIAGFVIRSLKRCISCAECLKLLEAEDSFSVLQTRKRYGALINPSRFTIDICRNAESCLRVFQANFNICGTKNIRTLLINKTLRNLPVSVYDNFGDHIFDGDPLNGHFIQLTKLILGKYFQIRIHHETAKLKDSAETRVRSILTKTILFKNQ